MKHFITTLCLVVAFAAALPAFATEEKKEQAVPEACKAKTGADLDKCIADEKAKEANKK